MTTPQDNKLSAFLEEMKKVGENATPGPWATKAIFSPYLSDHGVNPISSPEWMVKTSLEEISKTFLFIATARNNWEKLIKMNEILLEACEFYSSLGDFKPTHPCDVDVRFQIESGGVARKAIEKCKEIIG